MSNSKFIIQKWLDSQKLTLKEKKDIKNLSLQEQNIFFADETMKFGTAGVRGKMGPGTTRMNRFAYANLTQAYAKYIVRQYGKNKSIVVGHDNRMNSDVYALLAAKVLSSFGIKVLLFNKNSLMPTPIVSYAIRQTNSVGGLIITASHNPKEYNGFKAYHDDGGQILPDIAKMVEQHFIKPTELLDFEYTPKPKLISFLSNGIVEHYFKDAQCVLINRKELKEKKKYPIVLTAHHGTASKLLPKFLNNLNFKIKPVRAQMFYSPTFVNSPISNPEDIKSFDLSIKQADQLHSDICIGVDPDADRMAVCIKHNEK
jgi:phosphomannomutase